MAANASEPNSINTARNEPHFVSALARGKWFLFFDWLFQGVVKRNQCTMPGYLSFIAKLAFLFRLTENLLISSSRFTFGCQSTHLLWWKTAAKSSRGSGKGRKINEQALLGVGEDRRTFPPVLQVLSFFSLLRFCKFQTACIPRPLEIWPSSKQRKF